MKSGTKCRAVCAVALILALLSFSLALADEPVPSDQSVPLWVPPDPSTLKPMPPPSPRERAESALKKNASTRVAEITDLKEQNRISDKEWRARLLEIREEVNAAKRSLGLPVAPITTNKLNSQSLAFTTQSLDWLNGMTYVNQTDQCQNGCGVASATEVLDYEHVAYEGTDYTFEQVRQDLDLDCCSAPGCPGVCLSNNDPSIENTLDDWGTATYEVHASSSESGWFNDLVTSVSGWRYPQVMLTRPNFDGSGPVHLDGWQNGNPDSHHYIVVSGYNSTDGNVWYQESAWWTPGDKWWPSNKVWQVYDNADATKGCAPPYKLIR